MASHVLGEQMDIHGGGIDLTFPHHDNELAQSEVIFFNKAYFGCKQWVNYFMHTGHLHISGLKMSKSLKNFLSIRETLEQVTAAQLRIMFLMHQWDSVLDYSDGAIETAKGYETFVKNFFALSESVVREGDTKSVELNNHNHGNLERNMMKELGEIRIKVRERLSDSFDTPAVMLLLKQLVSLGNTYVAEKRKMSEQVNHRPLQLVKSYVEKMLTIFGVIQADSNKGQSEDLIGLAHTISDFRDKVRQIAQQTREKETLELCDSLRDVGLVDHGVLVEDVNNGPAVVKVVDREWAVKLVREKQEKMLLAQNKKEEAKRLEAVKEAEKWERAKIEPKNLFKTDEFEEWDERGIPLKLKGGEEVSKSKKKKFEKDFEKQTKLHGEYLSKFVDPQ
jgi:cysteinyl-tRNA synthetase